MYARPWESPLCAADAARRLRGAPGLCWLDGDGTGQPGRYSFVASDPDEVVTAERGARDPLAALERCLAAPPKIEARAAQTAFGGGPPAHAGAGPPRPAEVPRWAGFVSYDAAMPGRPLRSPPPRLTAGPTPSGGFPALHFARYDAWFVEDHAHDRAWLVGDDGAACARLAARLQQGSRDASGPVRGQVTELVCPGERAHGRAIETALEHIRRGDIYQVNLAHAWHGRLLGDPLWLALAMRAQSPVPFGAYLDLGRCQVITRSMERFLRWDRRRDTLVTRPIKGTRARGSDDAAEAQRLRDDRKERAEHAMIVDLMRNDLGRIAAIGSVAVQDVLRVEPYRGLYHLVSTVRCQPRPDATVADILRATFPPGSVTGTPKLRAAQIIDQLETSPRGPYTGAIGFIDRALGCSFAVAIRTACVHAEHVRYHAGGGIVAESDSAREVAETVLKARVFLDAIGARAPHLSSR